MTFDVNVRISKIIVRKSGEEEKENSHAQRERRLPAHLREDADVNDTEAVPRRKIRKLAATKVVQTIRNRKVSNQKCVH